MFYWAIAWFSIFVRFAYSLPTIARRSPFAISVTLDLAKDRMEIDYGLYQLLIIYHATRELNRIKPDLVVWLTAIESHNGGAMPSADDILRRSVSTELYDFLKALPGLYFKDGLYVCSEFGEDPTSRYGPFGKAVMMKIRAWTLIMYDRVLQYDHDQFLIKPAGFDRIFGVSGVQDEKEKKMLREQDMVGFVGFAPFHGANILLKPNIRTYKNFCQVIKNGFKGYEGGWENRGKFQSPFCEYDKLQLVKQGHGTGSNVAGGEPGTDWLRENFLQTEPAKPDDWFDWKFHFAQWDQGIIWYYFMIKPETRTKVWLTSFSTNSSFTLNPNGEPKCEIHPYLSIFESSLHFGGHDKMVRMGSKIDWIDRAMAMSKEFNILRFDKLRGYHESWIGVIKKICCEGKNSPTCSHFLKVCGCKC